MFLHGLPINPENDQYVCGISSTSARAALLGAAEVVVFDEIAMVHKWDMNAINKTYQDIMGSTEVLGGKSMVALADFRQTAPIPRKLESHSDFSTEIIASSIRSLHDFTPKLFVVKLTEPVRFEDSGWANFVEGVGGDTTLKDTEGRLEVPGVELVGSIDDELGFVFQNDYSSANCKSNVILAIDNKSVEEINNHVIHNKVNH